MVKIAVIIVNYNLRDAIYDCLASIDKTNRAGIELEVIVIDNASTDGLKDEITQTCPLVTYIYNTDNLGFSGGNNVGILYALKKDFDYITILNPDVYVDAGLFTELYYGFALDAVGITVPKVYFATGFEYHKDRYTEAEKGNVIWYAGGEMDWNNIIGYHRGVDEVDSGQFDDPQETPFATGNCMMVKREVFEKVGRFDERYFLYYEDADLSMRVKKAGYAIRYVPTAKLWHKNGLAAGGSGSPLQDYFISRNRLLFGFTYASVRTKFALARESIKHIFSYQTRRLATIDFYTHNFGKGRYLAKK